MHARTKYFRTRFFIKISPGGPIFFFFWGGGGGGGGVQQCITCGNFENIRRLPYTVYTEAALYSSVTNKRA